MQFPIFTSLFRVLFPERCVGCARPGNGICESCMRSIPLAKNCPEGTYAVFEYGHSIVRSAIRSLKYYRKSAAVRALTAHASPLIAEYISESLQSTESQKIYIVPIPTHSRRSSVRGFNQSSLIAQWIDIPDAQVIHCLQKDSATLPQAQLNRTQRLRNVAHTMSSTTLDPKGIYVVLDDVITTGATCTEAKRALRAAGARKIFVVALAHGYAKP